VEKISQRICIRIQETIMRFSQDLRCSFSQCREQKARGFNYQLVDEFLVTEFTDSSCCVLLLKDMMMCGETASRLSS
jgi:hypothetical protein